MNIYIYTVKNMMQGKHDGAYRMQLYAPKIQEIGANCPCMSFCLIFIFYDVVKQYHTSAVLSQIARGQMWNWFCTTFK